MMGLFEELKMCALSLDHKKKLIKGGCDQESTMQWIHGKVGRLLGKGESKKAGSSSFLAPAR
jgi:hypothetical protein